MKNGYWLYIEPYAHIFKNKTSILVYNTLNGLHLEYPNELEFKNIFKKILLPRNNRVISLSVEEVNDVKINSFIDDIRKIHAGDLLKKEWSKIKPAQITPILNLQNDTQYFKKKEAHWIGNEMMNYLYELSIYINNFSDNTNNKWNNAYKQILLPYSEKKQNEIELSLIRRIIKESCDSSLNVVNIIGGNIFLHSKFTDIIDFLNEQNLKIIYHIDIADLCKNIDKIEIINKANSYISLCVLGEHFDIRKIKNIHTKSFNNISYKFVIENAGDLDNIENFIKESGIKNFSLNPLFDTKNLDFFKKNVFTTRNEVLENKHSQIEIFQNEKINTNFFGKILLLANGDAYANVNEKKLGNINKNTLNEIVYKEMYFGKSWFKTRKKIKPCNDCIYNLLCPPISNYEIAIKKNNLCNITF